jgi:hypothetical protein
VRDDGRPIECALDRASRRVTHGVRDLLLKEAQSPSRVGTAHQGPSNFRKLVGGAHPHMIGPVKSAC